MARSRRPRDRSRSLRHEAGIGGGLFAAEALRRAAVVLPGVLEISGTVARKRRVRRRCAPGASGADWKTRRPFASSRALQRRSHLHCHRACTCSELTTKGKSRMGGGGGSMPFLGERNRRLTNCLRPFVHELDTGAPRPRHACPSSSDARPARDYQRQGIEGRSSESTVFKRLVSPIDAAVFKEQQDRGPVRRNFECAKDDWRRLSRTL